MSLFLTYHPHWHTSNTLFPRPAVRPTRRRITLLSLPVELLSSVIMNLTLLDALSARMVCRAWHAASENRQVWRNILVQSIGTTIPRPFFLPKPIKDCSACEIEASLRRWAAKWALNDPIRWTKRLVSPEILEGRKTGASFSLKMAPGGRWLFSGYDDGSVWCFDLGDDWRASSEIEPHLLIPSAFPEARKSGTKVAIQIGLDFSSEEALGATLDTHHLKQLTIAVVSCLKDRTTNAQIDIWRVILPGPSDGGTPSPRSPKVEERLSTFKEAHMSGMKNCCLYGGAVAYTVSNSLGKCLVVVDWTTANGKTDVDTISRHHVSSENPWTVHLLPGGRVLTGDISGIIRLFNWQEDCPISNARPGQIQEKAKHIWQQAFIELNSYGITTPLVIEDRIHIIVPTETEAFSLTIPLDDIKPDSIGLVSVMKAQIGCAFSSQKFGLRNGVGMRTFTTGLFSAQYSSGTTASGQNPSSINTFDFTFPTLDLEEPPQLVYDQYSNRVIFADDDITYFYSISSSSVHNYIPN
ncbi:hypothetical protein DFP72DRAFT_895484 [Ephemerocybe angulata]|uniref:F-box domain-containing protein n=1 Tax=Ephemerocybe angulata TaxID=980116 RepID=A0A8H6M5V0_9AGAR|nr:hypothetical protein DFP72DRAFT_895484 [Tulosesus angulatus]